MSDSAMPKKTKRAAGFFVYRLEEGVPHFLVMKNAKEGHWSVPKGHEDKGDLDLFHTACRECEEETGLSDVLVHSGFRRTIEYVVEKKDPEKSYRKLVTYFVARCDKSNVSVSPEHESLLWLKADDAAERLKHETLVGVLRQIEAWL